MLLSLRRFARKLTSLATVMAAVSLAPACACGRPEVQPAPAATSASATPAQVRGMWVWRTRARLEEPSGTPQLLESCRSASVTEIYLSIGAVLDDPRLPELVGALHDAGIRVEALTGEARWYRPDSRAALLAVVDAVGAYNARVPERARFAGVHLDIEPHQLPENKGAHAFLPALAEALREGRDRAAARGLDTSADLPRFALQENGAAFAAAVPRIFLMLYELRDRSPSALTDASARVIDATYASSPATSGSRLVVGVSVDDYPTELEAMLTALEAAHHDRPRYAGWAIHDEARYRARHAQR